MVNPSLLFYNLNVKIANNKPSKKYKLLSILHKIFYNGNELEPIIVAQKIWRHANTSAQRPRRNPFGF